MTCDEGNAGGGSGGGLAPDVHFVSDDQPYVLTANQVAIVAAVRATPLANLTPADPGETA